MAMNIYLNKQNLTQYYIAAASMFKRLKNLTNLVIITVTQTNFTVLI